MRSLFFTTALLMTTAAQSATVVINEIVQSNESSLMIDHQFPASWVELYNESSTKVDLTGWSIGIDGVAPYLFPQGTAIGPHGYLVVCCDELSTGLHASFSLSTGSGYVAIFDAEDAVVDVLSHRKMPCSDAPFGRATDGTLSHMAYPTPGAANTAVAVYNETLPSPVFNRKGGVLSSSTNVIVSLPDDARLPDDAILCITTDGRTPTKDDAVISPFSLYIPDCKVIRARVISSSRLPSETITQTYIAGSDITNDYPVVCLTTDPSLLYDSEIGMLAGSEDQYMPNYRRKWRRPANVEIYDGNNLSQAVNQRCEIAPQGWSSLQYPQKSLKVYSGARMGTKRIVHALWPDDKPDVTVVQSFTLRNGGNTFFSDHLRDSFLNRLFGIGAGGAVDYQAHRPAMVFINGNIYGYVDLRERSNGHFVEANYPQVGNYLLVENWRVTDDGGDDSHRAAFYSLYTAPETTFEQLTAEMDIDSFITSMLADAYSYNVDTPDANKVMWKPVDGKWRWLLKDMDCSMYLSMVEKDYIDYLNVVDDDDYQDWFKNTWYATALYRKCLSFPEFTEMMVDRFVAFNGDFLQPSHSIDILGQMKNGIAQGYDQLAAQYGFVNNLNYHVNQLEEFLQLRGKAIMSQLRDRYDLGNELPLVINNNSGMVSLNGHRLSLDKFDGNCFSGRELRLFSDETGLWTVTLTHYNGSTTIDEHRGNAYAFTPDDGVAACKVDFMADNSAMKIPVETACGVKSRSYYTLQGVRLSGYPTLPGAYIETHGNISRKIIIR